MKKKLLKNSAAFMAMFLMSMSASVSLNAQQCAEPDHFITYPLDDVTITVAFPQVLLTDQWLTGVAFNPQTPTYLFNPATKFHNGQRIVPNQPKKHLVSFPLDAAVTPDLPIETVRVINQFSPSTGFIINVIENVSPTGLSLLVPSGKTTTCPGPDDCPTPPVDQQHFLCYPLTDLPEVDADARFSDQFQSNKQVDRLTPTRFCNPVAKTVGVNPPSPNNQAATNHLMCFSVCPKHLNPARFVTVTNQFAEQTGLVFQDEEICVPSIKTIIPPVL